MKILTLIGKGILEMFVILGIVVICLALLGLVLFVPAALIDAGHPYIGWCWYMIEMLVLSMVSVWDREQHQ